MSADSKNSSNNNDPSEIPDDNDPGSGHARAYFAEKLAANKPAGTNGSQSTDAANEAEKPPITATHIVPPTNRIDNPNNSTPSIQPLPESIHAPIPPLPPPPFNQFFPQIETASLRRGNIVYIETARTNSIYWFEIIGFNPQNPTHPFLKCIQVHGPNQKFLNTEGYVAHHQIKQHNRLMYLSEHSAPRTGPISYLEIRQSASPENLKPREKTIAEKPPTQKWLEKNLPQDPSDARPDDLPNDNDPSSAHARIYSAEERAKHLAAADLHATSAPPRTLEYNQPLEKIHCQDLRPNDTIICVDADGKTYKFNLGNKLTDYTFNVFQRPPDNKDERCGNISAPTGIFDKINPWHGEAIYLPALPLTHLEVRKGTPGPTLADPPSAPPPAAKPTSPKPEPQEELPYFTNIGLKQQNEPDPNYSWQPQWIEKNETITITPDQYRKAGHFEVILTSPKICTLYISHTPSLNMDEQFPEFLISSHTQLIIFKETPDSPERCMKINPPTSLTIGRPTNGEKPLFDELNHSRISRDSITLKFLANGNIELTRLARNSVLCRTYEPRQFDYPAVETLWPEGIDTHMQQNQAGDCYWEVALDTGKNAPQDRGKPMLAETITFTPPKKLLHEKLRDKIKKNPPFKKCTVQLKGDIRSMNIKPEDIQAMKKKNKLMEKGAWGDLILTTAYARLVKQEENGEMHRSALKNTVIDEMDFEGGLVCKAWETLFGDDIETSIKLAENAPEYFSEPQPDRIFATTSLQIPSLYHRLRDLPPDERRAYLSDEKFEQLKHNYHQKTYPKFYYNCTDINGQIWPIYCRHAFGIKKFNPQEKWVEISNPADNRERVFRVSFEEFQKKFHHLFIGEFEPISPGKKPT